jgi:hypothetical protein
VEHQLCRGHSESGVHRPVETGSSSKMLTQYLASLFAVLAVLRSSLTAVKHCPDTGQQSVDQKAGAGSISLMEKPVFLLEGNAGPTGFESAVYDQFRAGADKLCWPSRVWCTANVKPGLRRKIRQILSSRSPSCSSGNPGVAGTPPTRQKIQIRAFTAAIGWEQTSGQPGGLRSRLGTKRRAVARECLGRL